MATYVPKNLIGPAQALTSSVATYVSGAGVTPILRTIWAMPNTTSLTLTVSLGADAAGTRIVNGVALTNGIPYIQNMWMIGPINSAHAIDASSNATGTQLLCNISGYEYS